MASSRQRSVLGLIGSWAAYWAIVAAVKLGPAAVAIYRATHALPDPPSDVRLSFGNSGFSLLVTEHGTTTWSGSVHVAALALWIAGVPLALSFAWVYAQRSGRGKNAAERQPA